MSYMAIQLPVTLSCETRFCFEKWHLVCMSLTYLFPGYQNVSKLPRLRQKSQVAGYWYKLELFYCMRQKRKHKGLEHVCEVITYSYYSSHRGRNLRGLGNVCGCTTCPSGPWAAACDLIHTPPDCVKFIYFKL